MHQLSPTESRQFYFLVLSPCWKFSLMNILFPTVLSQNISHTALQAGTTNLFSNALLVSEYPSNISSPTLESQIKLMLFFFFPRIMLYILKYPCLQPMIFSATHFLQRWIKKAQADSELKRASCVNASSEYHKFTPESIEIHQPKGLYNGKI